MPCVIHAFIHVCASEDLKTSAQVRFGVLHSCLLEDIMERNRHEFRIPRRESDKMVANAFAFCQLSTALSQHFHPSGTMLFHFTIKYHYLLHCALMSKYLNPNFFWCYSGEDMMARIKRVIVSAHSGTPAHVLVNKAMQKYIRGLGYTLSGDCLVAV